MKHRLDPLLRPTSVAIVGASARTDSLGEWALKNLLIGGYKGRIYPVNPNRDELQGHSCFGSLAELPETPELVIFAVSDQRIEAALDEGVVKGADRQQAGAEQAVRQAERRQQRYEPPAAIDRETESLSPAGRCFRQQGFPFPAPWRYHIDTSTGDSGALSRLAALSGYRHRYPRYPLC